MCLVQENLSKQLLSFMREAPEPNIIKMSSSNSKYFFFLSFFSFLIFLTEADPIYSSHACTDSISYKPNTTFETNLNLLLSSLSSKARDGSHFYRTRTGDATPDIVNGLFLCRGDIVVATCSDCVSAAAGEIKRRCPVQKEAIIWYDVCMLRYSNQSFNRIVPSTDLSSTEDIAPEDKERFNQLLAGMLNSVAAKVLKSQTKFATEQVNFTRTETLYGLEQCTPDLTVFDCNTCLRSAIAAIPNCCDGKRGATVLLPACNIRYEFYPFFNSRHSRPSEYFGNR
ncbi:cysteine-rich receptor-like protein kinase 25 [Prosopis cineraria]|uniref:cysteine-rich receptor-like protein kinase 25 n=1 Tax=Prosopis cineraria TaxID=364024 RepID=UPI002410A54B|nr:cysteine-rich receptor-like protein kinase 25 [Prosopis cineraria]